MIQTNATLRRAQEAGGGEAYDGPAAAGADKWAGVSDAYLRERRERTEAGALGARVIDRVLLVEHSLAVDWRSGDVVTWRRTGSDVDETAIVQLVEKPEIDDPEIDDDVRTVRLTLEAA